MGPSSQSGGGADAACPPRRGSPGCGGGGVRPGRGPRGRGARARRSREGGGDLGVGLVVRGVGAVPGVVHAQPPAATASGSKERKRRILARSASSRARASRRSTCTWSTGSTRSYSSNHERSNRRATCWSQPVSAWPLRRRTAAVRGCIPLPSSSADVPEESTTTRSPSPASSKASRSRNSPIGERQMFPQHTTVTRYGSSTAGEGAASRWSGSLMPPSCRPDLVRVAHGSRTGGRAKPCVSRTRCGVPRGQSRSNQPGTPARKSARVSRPAPSGMRPHSGAPVTARQVDEVALLGEPGLVGPRPDDDAEQRQGPRGERLGREGRGVQRAQAGARDEDDAAADALVPQPGAEVGEGPAALVEPDEQPAGALDEDDLRLGGDLADPLRVGGHGREGRPPRGGRPPPARAGRAAARARGSRRRRRRAGAPRRRPRARPARGRSGRASRPPRCCRARAPPRPGRPWPPSCRPPCRSP